MAGTSLTNLQNYREGMSKGQGKHLPPCCVAGAHKDSYCWSACLGLGVNPRPSVTRDTTSPALPAETLLALSSAHPNWAWSINGKSSCTLKDADAFTHICWCPPDSWPLPTGPAVSGQRTQRPHRHKIHKGTGAAFALIQVHVTDIQARLSPLTLHAREDSHR